MSTPRWIPGAFALSTVASLALVVFYFLGEDVQVEGALLFVALGAMGAGIVGWAHLAERPEEVEERLELASPEEVRAAAEAALEEEQVTRRRALLRLLGGAAAALAAALAIPALSLGPRPGESLFRTRWRSGLRVVDAEGVPLRPQDLPVNGIRTVFPEGHPGDPDSQAVLIRLPAGVRLLPPGNDDWVVEGCVAYSKICTHAGCPVGLYRAEARQLLCPCHQSTFDVVRGCQPVFGPTARPLPQLPMTSDPDGYLVALSDFEQPVGPSFWNYTRGIS